MRSNNRIKQRYFNELEQNCQVGLDKRTTFTQRRKAVNYFVEFLNTRNFDLKQLDTLHIQAFLQYLSRKETYKGTPLASATIKQIYALVKSFYVRCFEKRITSTHPDLIFTKNLLRRHKSGKRKLPKYIDQERMQHLLNKCPIRWKSLLYFLYETGARISEVLSVNLEHLDLKRKTVQIFEPKTMNTRVTTLSETTIHLLKEYLSKYRPSPRAGHDNFLFINQQRRRMSIRAVQYMVKTVSTRILGEKNAITPHYFRAACAVHLLEGGVDIRQVQEIIGWKSLSIVQNYTRVTPKRQAELKEKFHPTFKIKKQIPILREEKLDSISSQVEAFRQEMIKTQDRYQEELNHLRNELQQEKQARLEERKSYEQRINELLKTQQRLILLMSQKSS